MKIGPDDDRGPAKASTLSTVAIRGAVQILAALPGVLGPHSLYFLHVRLVLQRRAASLPKTGVARRVGMLRDLLLVDIVASLLTI